MSGAIRLSARKAVRLCMSGRAEGTELCCAHHLLSSADIQLVVVGSRSNQLPSYKLGKVLLSSALFNPVGGRLVIKQLQATVYS